MNDPNCERGILRRQLKGDLVDYIRLLMGCWSDVG